MRHPNVLLYIGASTHSEDISIVTEWCEHGSLTDLIYDEQRTMTMTSMLSIAIDVAQGMNYLHSLEPIIIHRDLKSANILIDRNLSAKVGDFGLSYKTASSQASSSGVFGTPEYMAPEVMMGKPYDRKVDVYSYGVVLCELFSRTPAYSHKLQTITYNDILDLVLDMGATPLIPEWCGAKLKSLISRCLNRDPASRPSFSSIIAELRALQFSSDDDGTTLFQRYDLPRLKEMVYSSNPKSQRIACREISDMESKRSLRAMDCLLCGFKPQKLGSFSTVSQDRVNIIVHRIISLFTSKNDAVLVESLSAFALLLETASQETRISYREMIQEEGALQKLLIFLSSTNDAIRIQSSKIMSLLSTDLSPEEQVRFVDISYSGLNALTSLSGGFKGLEKLNEVISQEIEDLVKKRHEIDTLISQKSKLSKRLNVSCSILKSRVEEERRVLILKKSSGSSRDDPSRSGFFKLASGYGTMRIQKTKSFGSLPPKTRKGASIESGTPLANVFIDSVVDACLADAPASFLEYFGQSQRMAHTNVLLWDENLSKWNQVFIFLIGDIINVYKNRNENPDDAFLQLNLARDNVLSINTSPFSGKVNALNLKLRVGSYFLSFRTSSDLSDWSKLIDPEDDGEKDQGQLSIDKLSIGMDSDKGDPVDCKEIMSRADCMPCLQYLPDAFEDYFMGLHIQKFGYLFLNSFESPDSWSSKFCIFVNGELRCYNSDSDDPSDAEILIYVSGPLKSPMFHLEVPDGISEWSKRVFIVSDDCGSFRLCAISALEQFEWVKALRA
jgi:hypothetical protein